MIFKINILLNFKIFRVEIRKKLWNSIHIVTLINVKKHKLFL
jgi:hypothetical protein